MLVGQIQATVDANYAQQNAEMGTNRYALLFSPASTAPRASRCR
jgi:hypothetical protein